MSRTKDPAQAQAIGVRLRDARHRKGLSQRMLSARSGLDPVVISRLERGCHTPTVTTLAKLCKAMGIPLRDLIPM